MKKLLYMLMMIFILIFVSGCGQTNEKQLAYQLPPLPKQVKGSLVCPTNEQISVKELYQEWNDYNSSDVEALKKIMAIEDRDKRKAEAYRQWQELWSIYQVWKEQGSQVLKQSGFRIYGPIASGWMNEILRAMQKREMIISGKISNDMLTVLKPKKPTNEKKIVDCDTNSGVKTVTLAQLYKYCHFNDISGLTNEPGGWSVVPIDTKMAPNSELGAIKETEAIIESTKYPFQKTFPKGVEIYTVPAMNLYMDSLENTGQGITATLVRAYSPEIRLDNERVVVKWPFSYNGLAHELGHVWHYQYEFIYSAGADNKLDQYMSIRSPDMKKVTHGYKNFEEYSAQPSEILAEDFAHIFFTGYNRPWTWSWPNIDEDTEKKAKLLKFFLTVDVEPYFKELNSLQVKSIGKIIENKTKLTINGTTVPNQKLSLVFDDNKTINTISNKDGSFSFTLDTSLLGNKEGYRIFRIIVQDKTYRSFAVYVM